jgi:DNA-binding FadR family transcriptional regulator
MKVLITDIVSGTRPAGELLPREVDLAAEFDVSRGVARETIRAMEERGLISVKHGIGATVTAPEHWDVFDADVLAALLDSERSSEVLANYLECRRVLEVEAAGLAADRASRVDIAKLAAAFAKMEDITKRPRTHIVEQLFHEADVAFHEALVNATGNRALAGLIERLHPVLVLARFPLARPHYWQERALPEHQRILDAVADSNPVEAREAMADHLATIAAYLGEHKRSSKRGRSRRVTQGQRR